MSKRPAILLFLRTASLLGAATLSACAQPLLSPSDERSPFDRYDGVRSQHAPQQLEDEYGRLRPNLRGRLAPKE